MNTNGKLTPKQKKFCLEYMKDLNATKAAERAGYSKKTARFTACKMITKHNIQEYLGKLSQAQEERTQITADSVLERLNEIADRCLQKIPIIVDGKKTGEYKFDSAGANRALELIGKHKGMFIERTADVTPIITDEDFEKRKEADRLKDDKSKSNSRSLAHRE